MGSISADWTENQSLSFDDSSPSNGVEGKASLDLDTSGFIAAIIQLEIAFGASANGNATIRIRTSPDSGTTKDTELIFSQEVTFTVSTTKRISIPISNIPWIEIGIYNGNTVSDDITIAGKYAGMKYTTT